MSATNEPSVEAVTTSAFSSNSRGPGTRPWIRRPPSSTAAELEPGMPKLSSGISAVLATTLFAVSGAATPSSEPLPNFSGSFDQRRASL